MAATRCMGCLVLRHVPVFKSHGRLAISRGIHQANVVYPFMLGKRWFSSKGWILPEGYDTGITIYNSAVKEKVPLKTLQPGLITWYSCGPTVYDSAHIGHALAYVKFDIIRRILTKMFDLNVVMLLGVTDIDDKIIRRAQDVSVDFRGITKYYEEEFFTDMDKLRVMRPTVAPRVTEHVPHIMSFIQKVIEKKLAYSVSDGSVYFDTAAYGKYGKMVPLPKVTDLPKTSLKKNARDFALWKGAKPGEPFWESPWGHGRPGWHIECSAMASHILGSQIDLHSGGIDLLFPHHENEEAQCCAYHSCDQWCNYWIHAGHLHTKGAEKMSKSLYNTISVSELLEQHSVNSFRLFCLLSHYRNKVDYTPTSMAQANAHLRRIRAFLQDAYAYINGQLKCGPLDEVGLKKKLAETRSKVKKSLADDMDTVRAFDAVLELIALGNKELQTKPQSMSIARSAGTMVSICSYIHYLMEDVFSITFPSVHDAASLSLESGGRLASVMNSVVSLRHQVRSYALLQDENSTKERLTSVEKKLRRQERAPLLNYCDEFRSNLQKIGLHIKDHAGTSSWSVAEGASETDKFKKAKNEDSATVKP
ncbi:cysteine--tRNA ligase, mitochondrial-like [Penaeus monodon]|uniref:cysteine--tRNA ligase, mitochondrial-like n=1 Tax=Penaeus monodon TaxID=6687 RepID=UPI0018A725A1|nr:cysteine--tRNA ligase, mitochondrial-like [Penaeus monodon]XP_037774065.1 cysteine--tRNA ligase, mitochondrial-like [Penaeus monodon]